MPLTQEQIDDVFTSFDRRANGGDAVAFKPRFTLQAMEAITMTNATNYLVKGIIPHTGLAVVWGHHDDKPWHQLLLPLRF